MSTVRRCEGGGLHTTFEFQSFKVKELPLCCMFENRIVPKRFWFGDSDASLSFARDEKLSAKHSSTPRKKIPPLTDIFIAVAERAGSRDPKTVHPPIQFFNRVNAQVFFRKHGRIFIHALLRLPDDMGKVDLEHNSSGCRFRCFRAFFAPADNGAFFRGAMPVRVISSFAPKGSGAKKYEQNSSWDTFNPPDMDTSWMETHSHALTAPRNKSSCRRRLGYLSLLAACWKEGNGG